MTDVELDARVTVLEENGGGNTQNGKQTDKDILLNSVLFILSKAK